jgi:hypothetical protein
MTDDQLIQFLELLKADVINSLQAKGRDSNGQIAKQIVIVKEGGVFRLQLPGYLLLLETGRGPTRPNAIAANPPMIQRIMQWCQEKGIPEKAAWAIKKSIDKKGFKGTAGLLTGPLGIENINLRLAPILDTLSAKLVSQIVENMD